MAFGTRMTKAGAGARPGKKPRITAWSASRYAVYKSCPAKAHYKYNEKRPDPPGPPMIRGQNIHKLGEDYLLGKFKMVPVEYKLFAAEMRDLRKSNAIPEGMWAFTEAMTPVDWYGPTVWVRAKVDAHRILKKHVLHIVDFKTGSMRGGYDEQLELYAWTGMTQYPQAQEVITELWYLDQGQIVGGTDDVGMYSREVDMERLDGVWRQRVTPMLTDTQYAPTPGPDCRFCPYSKAKGGPCQY